MSLALPLLAALLSAAHGTYIIQSDTEEPETFVYIDVATSGNKIADVFVASLNDIQKLPSRHMFFDIVEVGDSYKITEKCTGLVLFGLPPSLVPFLGSPVMAKRTNENNDFVLWNFSMKNKKTRINNKKTGEFLYVYEYGMWNPLSTVYPRARTTTYPGLSLVGTSKWYIKKVNKNDYLDDPDAVQTLRKGFLW